MAITRRRFLVASATALPAAAAVFGHAGSSVQAGTQTFHLSGRGVGFPAKSTIASAGVLDGTFGRALFQTAVRTKGGLTFTCETTHGLLRGYVKPLLTTRQCDNASNRWDGVITGGLGAFAGAKGTFTLTTTPLIESESANAGHVLNISGQLTIGG
jgi:hypothetical protein